MSKGIGQKIAIKFTEDIVGPTLISDFSTNLALGKPYTSNGTINYRGYSATDGNTATANYIEVSGTDMFIEVDLQEEVYISSVKVWHYYSDARIYNNAKTEISLDGYEWHVLYDSNVNGTYAESSAGKEHLLETPVKARYVRDWLNGSNKNAGNHWVEIMVYGATLGYVAEGFTITGKEYQYVNGPLIPKEYKAIFVEKHPDYLDDRHLLVTLHPQGRFNNVEGDLTVDYDASKGNLLGRGGAVESFSYDFTPTDLEPKPNPHVAENIEVSAEATVSFSKVTYNQRYADEQITVSAIVTLDFIYVGIINP